MKKIILTLLVIVSICCFIACDDNIKKESYKVIFTAEDYLEIKEIEEGTKVSKPKEPTKDGFIFIGWYGDSEYTKVYDFNNEVNSDITLYGKFSDKTYLISKEDKDVFDIDDKEYYIFFVKESCPYCKKIKPDVNKYMAKVTELPEFKDKPNVYMIDLKTSSYKSIICRSYSNKNNDGQGTDGKFYVDEALKWDDLYIASFPSLIKVEEIDGVKRAKYVAQGATKVLNHIESLLK